MNILFRSSINPLSIYPCIHHLSVIYPSIIHQSSTLPSIMQPSIHPSFILHPSIYHPSITYSLSIHHSPISCQISLCQASIRHPFMHHPCSSFNHPSVYPSAQWYNLLCPYYGPSTVVGTWNKTLNHPERASVLAELRDRRDRQPDGSLSISV